MKLLIIRHAQSANNAGVEKRVADPTITDIGVSQANRLANFSDLFEGVDLLYVSPMRRTLQTAAPIATATGLRARVFTGLHEWGGVYEEDEEGHTHYPGLGRVEMEAIIPGIAVPEDVTTEGWWGGKLDVSRMEAVIERSRRNATTYLDYLVSEYPTDITIAIVTHGGFGSHLLEAALHVEAHPEFVLRFLQANTGHALIDIAESRRTLRWHNRTDHLPDELITY